MISVRVCVVSSIAALLTGAAAGFAAGQQTDSRLMKSVVFQFNATNQPHTVRNAGKTPATYFVVNWKSPGTLTNQPKAP